MNARHTVTLGLALTLLLPACGGSIGTADSLVTKICECRLAVGVEKQESCLEKLLPEAKRLSEAAKAADEATSGSPYTQKVAKGRSLAMRYLGRKADGCIKTTLALIQSRKEAANRPAPKTVDRPKPSPPAAKTPATSGTAPAGKPATAPGAPTATDPAKPKGPAAAPAKPGSPAADPAKPGSPTAAPAKPGSPAGAPVKPKSPDAKGGAADAGAPKAPKTPGK